MGSLLKQYKKYVPKLRTLLRQPITLGHLITIVCTTVMVILLMGAAPVDKPKFVAHAETLSPAPIPATTTQPIVKTTVIPYSPPKVAQNEAPAPVQAPTGLVGSIGYAKAGGNCVNQINPRPNGNPISWPVRSQTPTIGSAALFSYNHVGRVVGIWSNGDLEIAHENYSGGQHRFPRSTFRGFW